MASLQINKPPHVIAGFVRDDGDGCSARRGVKQHRTLQRR